ncbi:RNA-binding protein NOB1-like [Limulus polyphemus]|uniref:RNA-binding protein NOB1 n=1 Tax=Limulus polyphemus TaxID=6850 RepID=A0ABM1BH41_LIMPO|nr:RNA-binding protein NOB1-like [Limulus polyphemus]
MSTMKMVNVDVFSQPKEIKKKVAHLVVDSGPFIKNASLHELGEKLYTLPEVLGEIKDKHTKERLHSLPVELCFREPPSELIKLVSDFAKKSGDYPTLSAVDLRVLALTYLLEKEHVGTEHLKTEPYTTMVESKSANIEPCNSIAGFYNPDDNELSKEESGISQENYKNIKNEIDSTSLEKENVVSVDDKQEQELPEFDYVEESEDSNSDIEEDSWITPNNLVEVKKQMGELTLEDHVPIVACATTDFAMQNVLIQIGLKVVSVDGMLIRNAKTFILRCHACFRTTSNMDKKFCPNCGNQTLKRVEVIVNENGTKTLRINFKKPINIRGTKFSLPKPQGGKHANNPLLCADQPVPQNRPSKLGTQKTDALHPDYEANLSPFAMNDIYSRAANHGIRQQPRVISQRRNPNQCKRNTGKKKKKQ